MIVRVVVVLGVIRFEQDLRTSSEIDAFIIIMCLI